VGKAKREISFYDRAATSASSWLRRCHSFSVLEQLHAAGLMTVLSGSLWHLGQPRAETAVCPGCALVHPWEASG
jgi:hypothetical protein